jgi:hypothetical protein
VIKVIILVIMLIIMVIILVIIIIMTNIMIIYNYIVTIIIISDNSHNNISYNTGLVIRGYLYIKRQNYPNNSRK